MGAVRGRVLCLKTRLCVDCVLFTSILPRVETKIQESKPRSATLISAPDEPRSTGAIDLQYLRRGGRLNDVAVSVKGACVSPHWPDPALGQCGEGANPALAQCLLKFPALASEKRSRLTAGQCGTNARLAPCSCDCRPVRARSVSTAPAQGLAPGASAWRAHWPRATPARGPCGLVRATIWLARPPDQGPV